MNRRNQASQAVRKLTGTAILAALVIVLQVLSNFVRFGPFPITLALAPIIIGGAVYGVATGALLGFVFGLVVWITGVLGWDGGTVMYLMSMNAFATILICLVKGAAAGWLASLAYRALARKSTLAGVLVGGVVCPVVNTGLFVLGMLAFFLGTITEWAGGWAAQQAMAGTDLVSYVILGLCGVNFLVELVVNLLLATGITRIIRAVQRNH